MSQDDLRCGVRPAEELDYLVPDIVEFFAGAANILDVGCSNGALLLRLHERLAGADLSGVDISDARVQLARQSAPFADLHVADAQQALPFGDSQFEAVSCIEVIEHLDAPGALVDEIYRVLKPGGKLFLTTPNVDAMMRIVRPHKWYGLEDP